MSTYPEVPNRKNAIRKAKKELAKNSPCGYPPEVPVGLDGDLSRRTKKRHNKVFAHLKWEPVTQDTSEAHFTLKIKSYIVDLESRDHPEDDWENYQSVTITGKKEEAAALHHCKVDGLSPHVYYRWRVKAVAFDGCESEWSEYDFLGIIGGEIPDDVTGLTLDIDEHRAHISYEYPDEEDTENTRKNNIDHAVVDLYIDEIDDEDDNLIARDRQVHGEHKGFKIEKPGNHTFVARVRTVSEKGTRSDGVTTTATKNTPSQPAAPAVAFDAQGTRHARYRAIVTVATVADTDRKIDHYIVQLVHKTGHSTPTTNDKRDTKHIEGDASGDDLGAVFRNLPKRHFVYARTRAIDSQGKKSDWSSWTDAGKPNDSGATSTPDAPKWENVSDTVEVTHPTPRRLVARWDEPDDDEVSRWRVVIKVGATTKETGYTRNNKYVYRVPKADVDLSHTVQVFARNEVGGESTAATGSATPDDDDTGLPAAPSAPSAPSLSIDAGGPKRQRVRANVTAPSSPSGADTIVIMLAHDDVTSGSTPSGGAARITQHVQADATGDDRVASFAGIRRNHRVWVRARATNAGGQSSWSSWTTGAQAVPSVSVTAPSGSITLQNRRVKAVVTDPGNELVVEWRFVLSGGSSDTKVTRQPHVNFHISRAARNSSHTVTAFARDDLGNESSSTVLGSGVPNPSADNTDLEDVQDSTSQNSTATWLFNGIVRLSGGSGSFSTGSESNNITMERVSTSQDRIVFNTSTGSTVIKALSGGVQFGATGSAQLGFFGAAPRARLSLSNISDSTGGSVDGTLASLSGGTQQPAVLNNNFADLANRLQSVITGLRNLGFSS